MRQDGSPAIPSRRAAVWQCDLVPHEKGEAKVTVTLINVFSVPEGKETDFVRWWEDVKTNITAQKGFISGKFHRSLRPESRYNFINVAIWENEELYWRAYDMRRA